MQHRKSLSTTIGASSDVCLHRMVESGKAESVGEAVEVGHPLDNRAILDHETARYFSRMKTVAAAEEVEI
jgi:hypothetical protein